MKTRILEWDIKIQSVLIIVNAAFFVLAVSTRVWLAIALAGGIYLLLSDILNLRLEHKSIGFGTTRKWYLSLDFALLLLAIVAQMVSFNCRALPSTVYFSLFVFVQIIFIRYFFLSKNELRFLRNREFFILK